jgi:hypothetical protein
LSKWETLGNIYGETTFEGVTDTCFAGELAHSSVALVTRYYQALK